MKKFIQGVLLPFAIFSGGILLIGCEQSQTDHSSQKAYFESTQESANAKLESGNMLYIVRDVADVQMKSGAYIEQLKETQTSLETAFSNNDHDKLKQLVPQLKTQITALNNSLDSLTLKSKEIDDIRLKLKTTNEHILSSTYVQGDINLSKNTFDKIENQMNTIQDEIIKLSSMMLSSNQHTKNS